MRARFLLPPAILLLLAASAAADVVRLKNGGRLEGKVLSQSDKEVVIETDVGRQTIPRADIEGIELGPTARDGYEEKLKLVDKENLIDLTDLADFCKGKGLQKELRDVYRMILRIDGDNEEAREALGYVRVEGEWVPRSRLKEIENERKRKEEEEKKKAAKEKGKGKPEAPAPPAGSIEASTAESAEADKAESESLKDFFGGTAPTVLTSANFSMKGLVTPEKARELLALLEKAYGELNAKFGLPPDRKVFFTGKGKRLHFLYVNDKATFNDVLPWVEKNYHKLPADFRKFVQESGSMASNISIPISVRWVNPNLHFEGHVLHMLGQTWIESFCKQDVQPWLSEGFAFYAATSQIGRNSAYCTTLTEYKGSVADKDLDNAYALICREMAKDGSNRPFRELMARSLNLLDYQDLAQAWGTVRYLIEGHPDSFVAFFKAYRAEQQDKALKDVLGVTPEEFDAGWREWVLKNLVVEEKADKEKKGKEPKKPDPKKKAA